MAEPAEKKIAQEGKSPRYTVLKLRLDPTPEQAALIEKTFGCCRYLWNRMLSDAGEFYAATDLQYIPTPARYKKEAPFLKEVDSQALCTVHQNLRKAFLDFFRAPGAFGPPRFKTKKSRRDSFTVYCRAYHTGPSIRLTGGGLQMPKLGLLRARVHRRPLHWWTLVSATVTKSRSGKYFCSLAFKCPAPQPAPVVPRAEKTLGLNYSLARFYVDSEGGSPALPGIAKSKEKLARLQRGLSRMVPGSGHYRKQLRRLQLQSERIANQRRDFVHKESRRIANAWDAVCVRDADLRELSRKLEQPTVLDFGFGLFRECLRYKLERQGKAYIAVDRLAPAARTCHECGCVNETLGAREGQWTCPHCGAALSRAVNTAKNLRDMGLAQLERRSAA